MSFEFKITGLFEEVISACYAGTGLHASLKQLHLAISREHLKKSEREIQDILKPLKEKFDQDFLNAVHEHISDHRVHALYNLFDQRHILSLQYREKTVRTMYKKLHEILRFGPYEQQHFAKVSFNIKQKSKKKQPKDLASLEYAIEKENSKLPDRVYVLGLYKESKELLTLLDLLHVQLHSLYKSNNLKKFILAEQTRANIPFEKIRGESHY